MPMLLLSTWSLPAARALANAARQAGWCASSVEECADADPPGKVVYYGGTDRALDVARRFRLALLEPPFDLLAMLPLEFRRRSVEFGRFGNLARLKSPAFIKPADALNKSFDAGVYAAAREIRTPKALDARTPVLVAEPVEWSAEYRCFVLERKVVAWSPYISFGRPVWKPFGPGTLEVRTPASVRAFCDRLFSRSGVSFPPAFVMDLGLIEERGWAVVEFNPAWCSGVLVADPKRVLAVLERSCQNARQLRSEDRQWVLDRPRPAPSGPRRE